MKTVKCGCGGEASMCNGFEHRNIYSIECNKCGICTSDYETKAEAITAWNKAMGTEKDCAHCVSYDKVRGYCNNYGLWIGDAFGCKDFAPYCEVDNE